MISGGQIPRNAFSICRMSKTSGQTGNLNMNEDLVNRSKEQFYYLTHRLDISQNSENNKTRIHQFGQKVLPRPFLGCAVIAEVDGIWEEDIPTTDVEEFGNLASSNISQKTERERSPDNPKT